MPTRAADRLIVALDFPNDSKNPERPIEAEDARRLVDQLEGVVSFFKVGWALYMAGGQELVKELVGRRKRVFLDLKFGDIPETVKRLVTVAARDGVAFLTLNAAADAIRAAAAARAVSDLKLLQVTALTSLSEQDLREMGVSGSVEEYVVSKAERARDAGADGVICSGQEARAVRQRLRSDFLIVTPGVRPAGASLHDQKRAVTPAATVEAGADYLVVGRPITTASDPRQAAIRIIQEMQRAFDSRLAAI